MKIKLNQVLVFVITLFISVSSFSQNFKTEKRIYLLDITGSMYGKGSGEDIFTEVKNNLIQTINSLDNPQTNITVITFGKGVVDIWEAQATATGKSNLITNINTHNEYKGLNLQTATNICDALSAANDKISIDMLNYLFLFTDGGHNFPDKNLQCVRDIVNVICEKNNRTDDVYPFYIMLTKKASSTELKNALNCFTILDDGCPTPEIVIVRPEKNRSSINLLENKLSSKIKFISNKSSSLPSSVKLNLILDNNRFFSLDKNEFELSPELGTITVKLNLKEDMSVLQSSLPLKSELNLRFSINYLNKDDVCKTVEMRPENIFIDVINKREKSVTITVINEEN